MSIPQCWPETKSVYVGEPVAVVIAASRHAAEDAADLVEIDYEPLEAVADCRTALSAGSPGVHRKLSHNLAAAFEFDYGDTDGAFRQADIALRDSFRLHRGGAHSIEGRGVVARHDTLEDKLTVWSSTQRPHGLKRVLCDLLRRGDESVRVVAPHIGGGFGPKLVCYPEEVVIALCAQALEQPVKWTQDRYEYFLSTTQERDQYWDVEIAFDDKAMVKGVRGALLHDHGAYTARGLNVPYASGIALPLAYNIPAYHLDVYTVLTNKVPVTPVRGAGQPQGVFVMERLLDRVAARLSMDRAEVRRRNLVRKEQMPCRKSLMLRGGTEVTLDSGDYPATQQLALEHAGWATFRERQQSALEQGRYVGIGLANFVEGTGRGPYETVTVPYQPVRQYSRSDGRNGHGAKHANHAGTDRCRAARRRPVADNRQLRGYGRHAAGLRRFQQPPDGRGGRFGTCRRQGCEEEGAETGGAPPGSGGEGPGNQRSKRIRQGSSGQEADVSGTGPRRIRPAGFQTARGRNRSGTGSHGERGHRRHGLLKRVGCCGG